MPTRSRSAALACTLSALVAPVLVACSASSPGGDLPDLPAIDPVWQVDDVAPFVQRYEAPPALWSTDELVVTVDSPVRSNRITVTGVDRGTGEVAWSVPVDGTLCSISSGLTEQGVGAVLYRPTIDEECVGVAAVDTTAGEALWTTDIAVPRRLGRERQAIVPGIGIGESSVNVTAGCGRVTRLDPSDGTPIETLGRLAPGFGCSGAGGVGGSLVAYADGEGRDAATVLLDTDETGRDAVLWRRPDQGVVEAVPSTDPLLLDRTDAVGRLLRTAPSDGRGIWVGLRMSPAGVGGFLPAAAAGDVVAGRYDGADDELVGLDAVSGEVLWERSRERYGPERLLVGARGDELVWVQGFSDPAAPGDDGVWVTTSDPRDPDEGRTLGAIGPGPGLATTLGDLWTVSGDLLLNYSPGGMTAYDLAAADAGATDGVTEVPEGFLDDIDDDLDWADDDVRPTAAVGACRDVSPATLAETGLDPDLPAPVRCGWSERAPGGSVGLDVTVEALEPSSGATAAETASARLRDAPPLGTTRDVGLGDEATLTTDGGSGYGASVEDATTTAQLRVRRGNVLASVTLTTRGGPASQPRRLPLERMELLTAAVARDVLAGAGVDLEEPPASDDGPVTTAPDGACATSPALARMAPGGEARPAPPSSDGRVRSCERRPPRDPFPLAVVGVGVEAVGPGLDRSAVDAATARLDALDGAPVDGVGDQAVLVEGGTFPDSRALVVREGNLVVAVRGVRGDDRAIRLVDLRRVASDALAATPG